MQTIDQDTYLKIKTHLATWQSKIEAPVNAKPSKNMAEGAILELYCKFKQKEPMIHWCDSPFQLGRIPHMVAALQSKAEWQLLLETLQSSQTQESVSIDEQTWKRAWSKLSKLTTELDLQINGSIHSSQKYLKQPYREKLKAIMFKIALSSLKNGASSRAARSDDSKTFFGLARIRDFASPVKMEACQDPAFLQNMMSTRVSVDFQTGILFQFALDGTNRKRAKQLKDSFRESEQLATRLADWFSSLPASYRRGNSAIWLPFSAGFLPFALGCRFIDRNLFGSLQESIDCYALLSHSGGGYIFCQDHCFVCPLPSEFHMSNSRPHNAEGVTAKWEDGYSVYAWKGRLVEPNMIKNKDKITWQRIRSTRNIERRRILIDIYGEGRFLEDAGAKIVAEDDFGVLYKLELSQDETMTMVKVQNSTPEPDGTFKYYYLRVPPQMERPRQAVAWTFGFSERDYEPLLES